MTTEIWKPVVGFEGLYEVSSLGRVRSLDRVIEVTQRLRNGVPTVLARLLKGRLLSPGRASHGYYTVSMGGQSYCIHDLVLEAFVGPRPQGAVCRHLDGDRSRSVLGNLEWGTYTENSEDSASHGTKVLGSAHRNAKLDEVTAAKVRSLKGVVSQSALAERFNVSPAAIQAVHDGRTWKHV